MGKVTCMLSSYYELYIWICGPSHNPERKWNRFMSSVYCSRPKSSGLECMGEHNQGRMPKSTDGEHGERERDIRLNRKPVISM